MNERFIYYLWQNRLFHGDLKLTDGRSVEIINQGSRNTESGPDFFNARIRIGSTEWAGNIEIHVRSSDWKLHHHHTDKNYENVILHVVFEDDQPAFYSNNELIPTLVIQDHFDVDGFERYEQMISSRGYVPCAGTITSCDDFVLMSWLENMAAERLMKRQEEIENILRETGNDWNKSYYIRLCRNFGFKVNAEPFELLGRILPFPVLLKHADNRMYIEAMIFGAAGFLDQDFSDEYPKQLQQDFSFFKKKFDLVSMEMHLWKFMRVHPNNFPTIRLAQFTEVIYRGGVQFSRIIASKNISDLKDIFHASTAPYWEEHYNFDKISTSPARKKFLGEDAIKLLMINTLIPFIFAYGRIHEEFSYCEKAIEFFQEISPENNIITRKWKGIGIVAENAMETQALLHLKQFYCDKRRCLECRIGDYLLRSTY